MSTNVSHSTAPQPHAEHGLPSPTLWPATLALGSTLLVWGLISSLLVTFFGTLLFGAALVGWIGEIRNERRKH